MSLLVRIASFSSVFALVSVQTALAAEDPFAAETPLSNSELREARGGFKAGGFEFNFAVDIKPLQLFPNGVFDDAGPLQGGGLFPEGVFGQDGVFGGQKPDNVTINDPVSVAANTNVDRKGGGAPGISTETNVLLPIVVPVVNTPKPAETAQPPAAPQPQQQPQQQISSSQTPMPVQTQTSSQVQTPSQTQTPAQAPTKQPESPAPTPSVVAPTSSGGLAVQSYSIEGSGANFVLSNTLNEVVIQQQIDFNIAIPNFDQTIELLSASGAATRALDGRFLLHSLQN